MKFLNLLKKELHELINKQMIIGLVITFAMLLAIGQITSSVMDDVGSDTGTVNICDHDKTDYTKQLIKAVSDAGFEVKELEGDSPDRAQLLQDLEVENLIIIPEGFTKEVTENGKSGVIEKISSMQSSSALASLNDKSSAAIEIMENATKQYIMTKNGLTAEETALIDSPLSINEVTVVKEKSAAISSETISGLISTQSMVIPIVVFILVMFTSQMIITAISTEKIDKTLETLLSAPVSRISVLFSKMLAAAIVALINAAIYMLGFKGYMGSFLEGEIDASVIGEALTVNDIMKDLGLKIGVSGYVLVGLQMFMTILVCLAVSLILGALVNDAKSAQTVLMPIMVCAMIPYLVSMIYDINLLSPAVRTLLYAIPFTHTFTAMNNIMFGNMTLYWGGLAYQVVLFIICMFFALRIFTSDKIFTISLNFGQKRKLKKINK